ncbi:hypothetical protein [Streptomyces bacillaris]|uniref:hypothetical protein n=1 Tax=Streptomyces bacillaris TaxID=68179 RepID=UPI0036414999
MTKQLTTQNATITTAAVEVKTLTISGKQVTLAVFRQLQEEPLIAEDGTLNGEPWGTVNYHPDKWCTEDRRPHWHVVWQRGTELRRARVDRVPHFDPDGELRHVPARFDCPEADSLLTGAVLAWLTGRRPECPLRKEDYAIKYQDSVVYDSGHGFGAPATASRAAMTAANASISAANAARWLSDSDQPNRNPFMNPSPAAIADGKERLAKAREAVDVATTDLMNELLDGPDYQGLRAAFKDACQAEADRRQRHRDARASVGALPQLFIAV